MTRGKCPRFFEALRTLQSIVTRHFGKSSVRWGENLGALGGRWDDEARAAPKLQVQKLEEPIRH